MRAASRGLGHGATFIVRLPTAPGESEERADGRAEPRDRVRGVAHGSDNVAEDSSHSLNDTAGERTRPEGNCGELALT